VRGQGFTILIIVTGAGVTDCTIVERLSKRLPILLSEVLDHCLKGEWLGRKRMSEDILPGQVEGKEWLLGVGGVRPASVHEFIGERIGVVDLADGFEDGA